MSKVSAKQAKYMQPVPHSFSRDGSVHFGDTLVLRHAETGAAAATDPQEKIQGEDVAVTGQPNAARAAARNTVVILPAGGRDGGEEGAPLCYGQTFRLACNPSLRVDDDGFSQPPLYLASAAATPTTGRKAPLTGHQQVCMTLSRGADTVWVVRAPNVGLVGSPVPADEDVVILHRNTNQALALDKTALGNTDFGREYEICCHTYKAKARPLPINHPAADLGASVPVESPNLWKFESSGSEEAARDGREFKEVRTCTHTHTRPTGARNHPYSPPYPPPSAVRGGHHGADPPRGCPTRRTRHQRHGPCLPRHGRQRQRHVGPHRAQVRPSRHGSVRLQRADGAGAAGL